MVLVFIFYIFTKPNIETFALIFRNLFLLLITLLCNLTYSLTAIPYSLQKFTTQQGLPNLCVYVTFRDSRGLVWCGTESGLGLYQGGRFIPFIHSATEVNSMIGGQVFSLCEDDQGNLWVGTFSNGILIFNPFANTYKVLDKTNYPRLVSGKNISSLYALPNHNILVNTSKGAYEINSRTLTIQDRLPAAYMQHDILLYKNVAGSEYFLCNKVGLLIRNPNGNWTKVLCPNAAPNLMGLNWIHGRMVITGYTNCYVLDNQQIKPCRVILHGKDISPDGINDVVEDKFGHVYLNSIRYGLLKANFNSFTFECSKAVDESWFDHGNALYSNFYEPNGHQFFIGTQQGLYRYQPQRSFFHESNPQDSMGTIRALQYTPNGILVGTEGGLFRYSPHQKAIKIDASFLHTKRNFFTQFIPLNEKEWLAVGNQFAALREKTVSLFHISPISLFKEENMMVAGRFQQQCIFISNAPSVITIFDQSTNKLQQIPHQINELISPPTLCFGNKLLIHTHSQLYELNMSDLKVHEIAKGFASGITDIQLYHHKLYASSQTDGILVLDTNYSLLQKINIEPIAKTNEVRSIHIVNDVIWFATPNGIGAYDMSTKNIRYYQSGEHFATSNFYAGSHTSHEDTLYFGGDNGIVTVNTTQLQKATLQDSIYLINISVFQQGKLTKVNQPNNHSFKFDENNLELQLVRTNTQFNSCFQYEYRLNHSMLSIPIEDNGLIKLYNLTPNHYQLEIIDKQTHAVKAQYTFTITPPWYQTWWFRTLLALAIAGNIVWITRLYFKRRLIAQQKELEKQAALQAERDRISNDMHDDLGSGLSSIKLISEMLKRKHQDDDTQNDLNDIVENATELTATMREMVWSLNPRNDSLDQFLHHIQQYSKHFFAPSGIQCNIHLPKVADNIAMNGFVRRNLFLTFKEIQNNIIKHAKATVVNIDIRFDAPKLTCSIQDNGKGLSNDTQFNNGFYTMQKRIQECGGEFTWANMSPGLKIEFSATL